MPGEVHNGPCTYLLEMLAEEKPRCEYPDYLLHNKALHKVLYYKVLYYSIACTVIVIHTMYYVSNRETRHDSTCQKFNIFWVTERRKTRTNNEHKLKINRHRILAQIKVRVGKTGKAACTLRRIYKASGVSSCGSSHRIFISSSTQQIKILTFQHYHYFILPYTTTAVSYTHLTLPTTPYV